MQSSEILNPGLTRRTGNEFVKQYGVCVENLSKICNDLSDSF